MRLCVCFLFQCFMLSALSRVLRLPVRSRHLQHCFSTATAFTRQMTSVASTDTGGSVEKVIAQNAAIVLQRVREAAIAAVRSQDSVRLVPVSKTKPAENIQELYDAGFRSFGENYFQELVEKAQLLPKDISWHFIGHLQSSKASKLIKEVPNLAVLETVDSSKLAGKLNSACESAGRAQLDVFIQVDTSGEATKSGVSAGPELQELLGHIVQHCPRLRVTGLMTIGAPEDFGCFDRLAACRGEAACALGVAPESLELSMGMSGDFEEAIRRGSTSVRVGSTIFGPRIYPARPGPAEGVEGEQPVPKS